MNEARKNFTIPPNTRAHSHLRPTSHFPDPAIPVPRANAVARPSRCANARRLTSTVAGAGVRRLGLQDLPVGTD